LAHDSDDCLLRRRCLRVGAWNDDFAVTYLPVSWGSRRSGPDRWPLLEAAETEPQRDDSDMRWLATLYRAGLFIQERSQEILTSFFMIEVSLFSSMDASGTVVTNAVTFRRRAPGSGEQRSHATERVTKKRLFGCAIWDTKHSASGSTSLRQRRRYACGRFSRPLIHDFVRLTRTRRAERISRRRHMCPQMTFSGVWMGLRDNPAE
jgi:hypothetical protein